MRGSVLRRQGIPECILLVTQRITKYPVLLDRILYNTKGNEEDHRDLGNALVLVKELITAVDQEVHECEKRFRLQDIYNRMDPKVVATMHSGRQFRREDLIRRKLVHDGFVLWKTATGRFKDIQVLLLTDVLIFLQEKDQRYSFPALDNKPAVISLQKLIVRDIANQEKGMFLISAAAPIPEMYEIHTASKEERNTWMKVIQQTVNVCPEMDDFSMEIETKEILRELADEIEQRDRGISELLEEKAGLFLQMLQLKACEDLAPELSIRKLFRSESADCPKGEKLLNDALKEVQGLSELMIDVCGASGHPASGVDQTPGTLAPGGTENTGGPASRTSNSEQPNVNGTTELCRTDSLNGPGRDRNGNQLQVKSHNEEAMLRLSRLSVLLHGLQAMVVKQDSLLETQRQQLAEQRERLGRPGPREGALAEQERARAAEQQREELAGLRRQHGLLQEEFQRCRRAAEERCQELRALEARLQESERERAGLEREREEWRRRGQQAAAEDPGPQACPLGPARPQLRRKTRSHTRQYSLPASQLSALGTNVLQQRRRSADESCLQRALSGDGSPGPWLGLDDQSEGPWPAGRGPPPGPQRESGSGQGTERGPAQDGGPCLRPEGLPEEEEEEEEESGEESASLSPSSSDDDPDGEQAPNAAEGSGGGQPGPAADDPAPSPPSAGQPEEDEDDMYY
uniref:rho guanine nucleotide exchange factor 2-like n=1 Tax=Pristiophorus japonicus TaxID=55135 RepID=UPI00398F2179